MSKYRILFNIFLLLSYIETAKAQTPQLWGMTSNGGNFAKNPAGNGTIFKINLDGSGFDTTHAFNGYTGAEPNGNLLLTGDGKLYGLTSTGGKVGQGVIFSIDPSNLNYTDVYDFDIFHGAEPLGSLVQDSNGILYGLTYTGGMYSQGVIFSFNPYNNTYSDLHDFSFTDGAKPYFTTPIIVNNKLYGLTEEGGNGAVGYGVLFSYNIDSNIYADLYNFDGKNGAQPYGSLLQASDNKLYGMCHCAIDISSGFIDTGGVIFSFDFDSLKFKAEYIFGYTTDAFPYGSLIQIGSSKLYGMTFRDGASGAGNIFSFDINTDTISDLYDFDGASADLPYGNLLQAANSKLYGMTSQGNYGIGNIFSFDLDSNTYKDIHDFNDSTGSNPLGSLIEIISTGIKPISQNGYIISVYPNPCNGEINIAATENIDELRVTNLLGQLIYLAHPKQTHFNFQLINTGMYFITVASNNKITTTKVIVSKQ